MLANNSNHTANLGFALVAFLRAQEVFPTTISKAYMEELGELSKDLNAVFDRLVLPKHVHSFEDDMYCIKTGIRHILAPQEHHHTTQVAFMRSNVHLLNEQAALQVESLNIQLIKINDILPPTHVKYATNAIIADNPHTTVFGAVVGKWIPLPSMRDSPDHLNQVLSELEAALPAHLNRWNQNLLENDMFFEKRLLEIRRNIVRKNYRVRMEDNIPMLTTELEKAIADWSDTVDDGTCMDSSTRLGVSQKFHLELIDKFDEMFHDASKKEVLIHGEMVKAQNTPVEKCIDEAEREGATNDALREWQESKELEKKSALAKEFEAATCRKKAALRSKTELLGLLKSIMQPEEYDRVVSGEKILSAEVAATPAPTETVADAVNGTNVDLVAKDYADFDRNQIVIDDVSKHGKALVVNKKYTLVHECLFNAFDNTLRKTSLTNNNDPRDYIDETVWTNYLAECTKLMSDLSSRVANIALHHGINSIALRDVFDPPVY